MIGQCPLTFFDVDKVIVEWILTGRRKPLQSGPQLEDRPVLKVGQCLKQEEERKWQEGGGE